MHSGNAVPTRNVAGAVFLFSFALSFPNTFHQHSSATHLRSRETRRLGTSSLAPEGFPAFHPRSHRRLPPQACHLGHRSQHPRGKSRRHRRPEWSWQKHTAQSLPRTDPQNLRTDQRLRATLSEAASPRRLRSTARKCGLGLSDQRVGCRRDGHLPPPWLV